jgi:murein DD-endopeptidase MepM/ murein hydrolase activator NlpD
MKSSKSAYFQLIIIAAGFLSLVSTSTWAIWTHDYLVGGPATSGPAISSWGSGRLDVFYRGSDNTLRHRWFAPGSLDWSPEDNLGGNLASDPAAVSWGTGRIDVFARGTDNALKHLWYQAGVGSGWQSWESLGGNLTSAPAVSSWGTGRLDIFALGTDNALNRRTYQAGVGAGWQPWENLGGNWTSAPDAVSWGSNRVDVVIRGTDSLIYQRVWHAHEPIKVSEMGHYCSITSPGAWDATWDSAGGDPCATLIAKHRSAVTIQRKGLFHKTNMNNAIVRCSEGVWVFTALGMQALKNAYDTGSGRSNCVITAAPREIPIFTKPVSDADITAFGWTAKQPCFPNGGTSCFGGYDHARLEIEPLELPGPGGTVQAYIVNYKGEPKPGLKNNHDAHDAGLPKGIPIRTVAAGTVVRAWCWDTKQQPTGSDSPYQKEVILEHVIQGSSSKYEERFYTLYAHLDSIEVSQGQYVDEGQKIGTAGSNGNSTGPHLHFQVHKRSNTANELLRPFVEDNTSVVSCMNPQPKNKTVVPHNLNPTGIDPWGWYGPIFDPWAYRAYDKGKGALSINLWKPGQAPAMDAAWD